jgi:hypothetical protein
MIMMIRKGTCFATCALLVYFLVSASAGLPQFGLVVRADDFVVCDADDSVGRGGDCTLSAAEAKVIEYLALNPGSGGKFHVHGWRWHTMSLVREADRLNKLAVKLTEAAYTNGSIPNLKNAADYVVGFNMKGLHKIERDLFFPWVRRKVDSMSEPDVAKAFSSIMDQLDSERREIEKLGDSVVSVQEWTLLSFASARSIIWLTHLLQSNLASIAADPSASAQTRADAIIGVAYKSAMIVEYGRSMLRKEDSLLVPAVARIVPESEQKSFNNKVIRTLGVFDSRLHLVGMHEAVWDLENISEREIFQEAIPSIPRMMIPRWKRLLYEPRVGELGNV